MGMMKAESHCKLGMSIISCIPRIQGNLNIIDAEITFVYVRGVNVGEMLSLE